MSGETSDPPGSAAGISPGRDQQHGQPKASENPFRRLFEATPTPYQSLDHEGHILDVNTAWLQALGYSSREVLGRSFADFQSQGSAAGFPQRFAAYLAVGEVHGVEIELVRRDGSMVVASYDGRIETDADGAFARTHCVFVDVTERRRSEQALAQAERRFRETIENVDLIGVGLDAAGCVSFVNDHLLKLTGWTRDEVMGRDWFGTFLPEEHADDVRDIFLRTLNSGDFPLHFDNPIVTRDGEQRLIHWSNTVLTDADGDVVGTFSLGEDRTEVSAAEATLRQSERLLRYIVEHDPNAIAVYDRDLQYIAVSQRYLRDYGVTEADVIGRHHYDVFPEMPERWKEVHRRCLAGAVEHSDDDFFERPDGSITYNRWICRPWYEADGSIGGIITYTEVTTDRKLAEIALRESEEKYRRLFTSMAEGFALHETIRDDRGVPQDYRLVDANPAFFELTGLPRGIVGRTVREVMPESEDFWIETLRRVTTGGEPIQVESYSAALGRHFEVRAFSPHPGQVATLFLDVSKRRRAQIERLDLLGEVRGLAARLAAAEDVERRELARELHDRVGQSLTALGLNLSALRSRLSAESIVDLGPRLDDAEELLRATAGEVRDVMAELRPPVLDEYGLVAALRWAGERFTGRTGVQVTVGGDEPEPRLEPETEMSVYRIVQEALTNVAKHACASSVDITVSPAHPSTTLTVTDDGRGFDPVAARARAGGRRTWGQLIMQERAVAVGATCTVLSRPGRGTTVRLEISRPPEGEGE